MYHKIFSKIALVFFVCGICILPSKYSVQAQGYNERLDEVNFSSDKGAVYKGIELYKYYWQQYNVTFDPSAPARANYMDLSDKKGKDDYIVLIRKTERGGVCARLGCEVSIFENTKDNRWRLVMHVFTHQLYISNQKTDGYYNLYVESSTKEVEDAGSKKTKFVWNGGKYVAEHRLENKKK